MENVHDQAHVIAGAIDRMVVVAPIRNRLRAFLDSRAPDLGDVCRHDRQDPLDDARLAEAHVSDLGAAGSAFLTRHIGRFHIGEAQLEPVNYCALRVEFLFDGDALPEECVVIDLFYFRTQNDVALSCYAVRDVRVSPDRLVQAKPAFDAFIERHAGLAHRKATSLVH